MRTIQHWNQPEEEITKTVVVGYGYSSDIKSASYKWNPHRGNVRVNNKEIKWYNLFK